MSTSTIKTAISVPNHLFAEVTAAAKELALSRSELFAKAAAAFIKKNKNRRTLAALNKAYKDNPDTEERRVLAGIEKNHFHLVKGEW